MKKGLLLYGIGMAIWVFTDAPQKEQSGWWAFGVLILPVLTPLYFSRTNHKFWKAIGLWLFGAYIFYTFGAAI